MSSRKDDQRPTRAGRKRTTRALAQLQAIATCNGCGRPATTTSVHDLGPIVRGGAIHWDSTEFVGYRLCDRCHRDPAVHRRTQHDFLRAIRRRQALARSMSAAEIRQATGIEVRTHLGVSQVSAPSPREAIPR